MAPCKPTVFLYKWIKKPITGQRSQWAMTANKLIVILIMVVMSLILNQIIVNMSEDFLFNKKASYFSRFTLI